MKGRTPIYLDNNATTPVDPRVLQAMLPYLDDHFGNAASVQHAIGRQAKDACDLARQQVASLLGASPREIVFTSGATESDNLALKGLAEAHGDKRNHFITATTEHRAVRDTLLRLEKQGLKVTWLEVDREGRVAPEQVEEAITPRTLAVSLMAANNEIGTLHPIRAIGAICKRRGILLHTDAVQAASTLRLDVDEHNVDLLSLSAHKMYGPKGVGALYVRKGVRLAPLFDGGGHERGLRSGTLPVPLIASFGLACELCGKEGEADAARALALRQRLWQRLTEALDGVTLNGHATERLAGNLNVSFAGLRGEVLAVLVGESVAISSGSACTSASVEPSHVLRALGLDEEVAQGSVRLGVGRFNTEEEIDRAADTVARVVTRLREQNPLYGMRPSAGWTGAGVE